MKQKELVLILAAFLLVVAASRCVAIKYHESSLHRSVASSCACDHEHHLHEESTEEEDEKIDSSVPVLPSRILWADLSEKAALAVGQLFAYYNVYNWLEPYKSPSQQAGAGTAFFVDDEGRMITNAHCVDQAVSLFIQLPYFGKYRFEVTLEAICHERDLALLKLTPESYALIKKALGYIPFLKLGDSDNVRRADEIMAIGFPLGQEWLKSTTGVVSGIQLVNGKSFIQISAAINVGNSGGPALEQNGRVIGVVKGGITNEGTQNVGYIIPGKEVSIFLDHVAKMKKDLKEESSKVLLVRLPTAGVIYHGSPEPLISYLNNPEPGGIYVIKTIKGSLFEQAGVKTGDMIYEINGYSVDRFGEVRVPWSKDKIALSNFISQLKRGDEVTVVLYRQGKKMTLKMKWKITENPLPIRYMHPPYEEIPYLVVGGMVITPVTLNHVQILASSCNDDLADFMRIDNQQEPAVMIAHVLPNSVAQHSRIICPGLVITHLNDERVNTILECDLALRKSIKSGYITFKMKSGEFFVAHLTRVLEDEVRLSRMYFYPLAPVIQDLLSSKHTS